MTTPHPHAHLMALYAQDAAETDKPWLLWQWRSQPQTPWEDLETNPMWDFTHEYRRKPKTIKVNGFDVPAPVRTALNGSVWLAAPHAHSYSVEFPILKTDWEMLVLQRGLFHATEKDAVAHAKAMLGIDPEGTV